MLFLVYSDINSSSIRDSLGMPEYSYYFVLKAYVEALQGLGEVIQLSDPSSEADALYAAAIARGEHCLFICFAPPHRALVGLQCPTLCVFAWEFSNLPYEVWDGESRNDWRTVLAQHGRTITLSKHTESVVKQTMGNDFPVRAIPVPVYRTDGERAALIARELQLGRRDLRVSCTAIDNSFYEISADTFRANIPPENIQSRARDGEVVQLNFKLGDEDSGLLGGFYEPEPWGVWSRIAAPWILLPYSLSGRCKLGVELVGYGPNVGASVQISIGGQMVRVPLTNDFVVSEHTFDVRQPANVIQFSGLDVSGVPSAPDPRSMGIGIRRIWLTFETPAEVATVVEKAPLDLAMTGVVYTSIFNPGDDRKNWIEMLTAFCYAFRDEPGATLVLKMTHRSMSAFLGQFHYQLQRIGSVKCRVIILHGYLENKAYRDLIDISTYCVNTSRCEGLCLPLMEFMSCGVPALAPNHTAMQDYVSPDNTFIIDSSLEAGIWPHDPRNLLRTLRYRINWSSVVQAFQASFKVAMENPLRYRQMSIGAQVAQRNFCSVDVVRNELRDFLMTDMLSEVIAAADVATEGHRLQ